MPWTPTDYGMRTTTIAADAAEALVISDNVVSARLNYELGPAKGVAVAHDLGLSGRLTPHLSSVLGTNEVTPLDMAAAFAPFANGGKRVEPWAIRRVEDRFGRLMEEHKPQMQAVADSRTIYVLTSILQGVTQPGGTASVVGRTLDRPAAGKTGTSQGNAWFVGYTPELVAAVYVGNDVPAQDVYGTGGGLAAPIFANFVKEALAGKPAREFARPKGIVELDVCSESGLLATRWCPPESVYKEIFVQGTQPWQPCTVHTPWSSWQLSWPFGNSNQGDMLPPEAHQQPSPGQTGPAELPERPGSEVPAPETSPQPSRPAPAPTPEESSGSPPTPAQAWPDQPVIRRPFQLQSQWKHHRQPGPNPTDNFCFFPPVTSAVRYCVNTTKRRLPALYFSLDRPASLQRSDSCGPPRYMGLLGEKCAFLETKDKATTEEEKLCDELVLCS